MKKFHVLLCALTLLSALSNAQNQTVTKRTLVNPPTSNNNDFTLQWKDPVSETLPGGQKVNALAFEGAIYQNFPTQIPVFHFTEKAPGAYGSLTASLINPQYIPLTPQEKNLLKSESFAEQPEVRTHLLTYKKIPHYSIEVVPFRSNPATGQIEKLASFSLDKKFTGQPAGRPKAITASSSVLKSGNWYKIAVVNDGIYKIDHAFLETMGIDPASFDATKFAVYGQPGGMLPFANASPKKDDLKELGIHYYGDADGTFNQGDFILFYGQSPHRWTWNASLERFESIRNVYSDTTYYFFTPDQGTGKRVGNVASLTQSANATVTQFDDYRVHEEDLSNIIKSGRNMVGESFEITTSRDFTFSLPSINTAVPVDARIVVVARSQEITDFIAKSGSVSHTIQVPDVLFSDIYGDYVKYKDQSVQFPAATNFNIKLDYQKPANSLGWLDKIEINFRSNLKYAAPYTFFRDVASVNPGNVVQFTVQGLTTSQLIWDVTDPLNPKRIIGFSGNSFKAFADTLREYVIFTTSGLPKPLYKSKVPNQNLHAFNQYEYLIVSHPDFISAARALADIHKADGMRVAVVTTEQVYNEFGAGSREAQAIRDYAKMFYDRASTPEELPKYLLLFGDGSYDNKTISSSNSNFIPTYQSETSGHIFYSYVSDDFFAALDDDEGMMTSDGVDLAVGRMPVQTLEEAEHIINKIRRYRENTTMKPWRNRITFLGDDEDGSNWVDDSETCAGIAQSSHPEYDYEKIYLDAYRQISTPGGQRYPEAHDALMRTMEKGTLILNYIGHGGETGLTHEQVLTVPDVNSWTNIENMPLFFTATCEFSRYDDYARTSAGELCLLNPKGGAIALMTTVRVVSGGGNLALNTAFFNSALDLYNGKIPTMGDLFYITKSQTSPNSGRNFAFLGDPALKLNYPKEYVVTTEINGASVSSQSDTLQALSKVTIKGMVTNEAGQKLSSFNGLVYPIVFDKEVELQTLSNDPGSPVRSFNLWKNVLYKGKASVVNGDFSFTFIVPKDISYEYGIGRISYYAENGQIDAHGFTNQLVIGGTDSTAMADETGPEAELYMNDIKFVFGGITDENPNMLGILKDEHGINTSGTGIGHDLTGVLDGNTDKTYVLNDYYEADLDSYQSGKVLYPFKDLSEGRHTLRMKAWDVYNNSAEAYTEFVVAKSAEIALEHVLNYPNPFTTYTEFWFEHNQPGQALDVQIQVFTVTGKLVKTLDAAIATDGYRADPIPWDGRDEFGDKIGRGVYVYRLMVRSAGGAVADKFEKLVILQ